MGVQWDTDAYRPDAVGRYTLTGTLILPAYLTNPDAIGLTVDIRVEITEITGFTAVFGNFLQQGKTSVEPGAELAVLSAGGGDGQHYRYSLLPEQGDNRLLNIEDNRLLVGGSALTQGEYAAVIEVTSGGKSRTETFSCTVGAAGAPYWISSPYEGIDWGSVHQVKAALHNHTVNTNTPIGEWNDGVSGTVDSRIAVYDQLGYGAVSITDHDYVSYPWDQFGLTESPLIAIAGNELSKNAHMLSYFSTYFDQKGQGPSATAGMLQNIANAGGRGGFLYIAHPSRSGGATRDPAYDMQLLAYPQVRGLEVLNAGQFTNNHSEELWDTLLTDTMPGRPIWGTASDDSHSDSLSTIGTGWTYLLLSEKTQSAAKEAMINGQTYFSSWRVEKGKDDNKQDPGVPAPTIEEIIVDQQTGVIELRARNAARIEWISSDGRVVAGGSRVNVNTTPGVSRYIRARLFGDGGQTMTQPFGLQNRDQKNEEGPVITVAGELLAEVPLGQTVTLPAAEAEDKQDGAVFAYATVTAPDGSDVLPMDNAFTPAAGGVYTIRYHARDSWNNESVVTRTLAVTDKKELAALIEQAQGQLEQADQFTADSVKALRAALAEAQRVLKDESASYVRIAEAVQALKEALPLVTRPTATTSGGVANGSSSSAGPSLPTTGDSSAATDTADTTAKGTSAATGAPSEGGGTDRETTAVTRPVSAVLPSDNPQTGGADSFAVGLAILIAAAGTVLLLRRQRDR